MQSLARNFNPFTKPISTEITLYGADISMLHLAWLRCKAIQAHLPSHCRLLRGDFQETTCL